MFWRDGTPRFNWAIGMMVPITFPTGDATALRGTGGYSVDPRLLGSIGGKRWDLTLNFGYRWRSNDGPANLHGTGEITYGAAATVTLPVWKDRIDLNAELIGGFNHAAPVVRDIAKSPLELLLGMILRPHHDWSIYVGAGPGLTSGVATPDFRVFAGVRFARRVVGKEGYRDSDGDGIIDANDQCPKVPEDRDGFEDHDGCPDLDNDRDGIPDDEDECPNVAGQRHAGDGNGCPKRGYAVVRHGNLLIFGKVLFESGSAKLTHESENLVDQIAEALKTHPEVAHLRVEGHTDDLGGADLNMKLSQQRAESVMHELKSRGVDERRLTARGYGETRPLVPNSSPGGRAKNRRVEFVVVGE
jgi:outer membrane protein OmpA-like peptidoglycan-associated protein